MHSHQVQLLINFNFFHLHDIAYLCPTYIALNLVINFVAVGLERNC